MGNTGIRPGEEDGLDWKWTNLMDTEENVTLHERLEQ